MRSVDKTPCFQRMEALMGKFGLDPDDVFAFRTPRIVAVRDAKLGITNLLLIVGIVLFIIIKNLVIDEGFRSFEPIRSGNLDMDVMDAWEVNPPNHGFNRTWGRPAGCTPGVSCGGAPPPTSRHRATPRPRTAKRRCHASTGPPRTCPTSGPRSR